jgi:hypothetical protein
LLHFVMMFIVVGYVMRCGTEPGKVHASTATTLWG